MPKEARMKPFTLPLLFAAIFVAHPSRAQVIFIDPCDVEIQPFETRDLNVWACIEGSIAGGITAAEFRIAGLPTSWPRAVQPDAAASSVTGDLFGNGVRIAFPSCRTGVGQYLHLFDVQVTAFDASTDVVLMVATNIPSSDPNFDCSFVSLCDSPTFTKVCVRDHGSIINPRERSCGLPIERHSWTSVKALYQ
jgi:hypothetical protein